MKPFVSKIKYSSRKKTVKLKGRCQCTMNASRGILLLQERIKGNDLYIPRQIQTVCKIKRGIFNIELDASVFCDLNSSIDIWDSFLIVDEDKQRLMFLENKSTDNLFFSVDFCLIEFYKTINQEFSIRAKKNNTYKANLQSFSERNNYYLLSGECIGLKLHSSHRFFLSFRKRDNKNSILYKYETNIPVNKYSSNRWHVNVDKQLIFPASAIFHEEVWDIFIKLENKINNQSLYLPLHNKTSVDDHYTIINKNVFYQAKFYINKKKCVALWIKRKPAYFEFNNIYVNEDGQLNIHCSHAANEKIVKTKLELDIKKWSDTFSGFYLDGEVTEKAAETVLSFPLQKLKTLYKLERKNIFIPMVLIGNIETRTQTWMPLFLNKNNGFKSLPTHLTADLDILIKITTQHLVKLVIVERFSKIAYHGEPVKLAILGTCYTRGAFNSSSYFNPNYKEKYDIVYTQFHSSIPSLMSLPVSIPFEFFANRKPVEREYLECDFKKLFFNRLSQAKAEYFLFDLYPDAVRDLIVFDDNHIITGSFYLQNQPFLEWLNNKASIISHNDEQQFLAYWCKAADQFTQKIINYFSQDRIILQKARMTNQYYDEKHQIKYFEGQLDLVKRSNAYYKFMESYILQRLPHIHIIDLNNYGYIGQYNHPYLKSTNHYEPAYYKKMIQKMDSIIFRHQDK